MKVLLTLLTSVLFLSACDMQQDPLANASDQVREGHLPDTNKPVPEKPIAQDGLVVDAPERVNARVGSEVQFKVGGRVMIPGVTFKMLILNLADFPGAKFDEAKGEFSWTPPKSLLGSQPNLGMSLKVALATDSSPTHPTVSVRNHEVRFIIENTYTKPIVNTIEGNSGTLVAGKSYDMTVTMEDLDAYGKENVSVQVRDCANTYYTDSIAHFVEVKNIKDVAGTAGKYTGTVVVNLINADTLAAGTYCFGLVAVSKHGVASDFYKREVTVEPRLRPTKMTMEVLPNLTAGESMQVAFSIYDPANFANVRLVAMDDIATALPGSSLYCKKAYGTSSQLDCAGLIKTEATTTAKNLTLNIKVESVSPRSALSATSTHTLRINVKAAN